jgi:exo-beta-1,3-glucanase (GH17 family)
LLIFILIKLRFIILFQIELNCIAYEPFSDPNYPGNVNAAIRNTLKSIQTQGFRCIKTYYSQYYGLKIADYAAQFGLKIVLGIRMEESFRENEIQSAIDSCKSFNNIIAIYAGNENLPNNGNSNDIINIKNRVKSAGCNVPFGTVQTIGYFLFHADRNLVNQMDWLGYNVYPFFSNLGSSSPANSLRAQIDQIRKSYGSQFSKFIISETGWPSAGGRSDQGNNANIDDARRYADQFASMLCSGEINTKWVSYFTYFDPSYKQNVPEFEKNFGIADRYGNPKWNIENLHC